MGRRNQLLLLAAMAATVTSAVGGCAWSDPGPPDSAAGPEVSIFPEETVEPLLDSVPERTVTALPPARLADDLIPPTNRWFSGLVFGEPSMPVFPLPLSFQLTDTGLSFGLPQVSTSSAVILGGFVSAVTADVGAQKHQVVAYDTASVTVAHLAGGEELGRTVIAQGSPFVAFTATRDTVVELSVPFTAGPAGSVATAAVEGTTYGMLADGEIDGAFLDVDAGSSVSWFPVPADGELDVLAAAAGAVLTGTSLSYTVGSASVTTSITYRTVDESETLVAVMPHQRPDAGNCSHGTYPSVYGELRLCRAGTLSWTAPLIEPLGSLDLGALSDDGRSELLGQLEIDAASTPDFPADTYFGGKAMYRTANLLGIARDLGAKELAATLKGRLVSEIDLWTQPEGCADRASRCFVYDPVARGMVGLEPSFGSDQFNDHHFHYGYLLYAAAVAADGDDELVRAWSPVLDLVAADLATSGSNPFFPERRVFDAYAGHSWASGTSPFADGNNQESSSEAVTAWNGLALWARASDQPDLFREAVWMLSAEAASARAYWTDFPLDDAVYEGFDHTVTSLVWGGKRDYATWFSAEPSAMLGILVLPMSPVSGYLAGDPQRIRANVEDAAPGGFDVMFGDYLLMYSALSGKADATAGLVEARALPDARIDDGNSRTYLLAWLLSRGAG